VDLKGKVAIVTGAGGGIGEGIARALNVVGANVVVSDITGGQNRVAESLGAGSLGVATDVRSGEDIAALVEHTMQHFGRLDVLCNNAGIDGQLGPVTEVTTETFDDVLAVNLRGVFLGMRYGIPAMLKTGGGSIINIASVAGIVAFPGTSAYTASKAGVLGLTRVAAAEYGQVGIRVNAICPGVIDTPMLAGLQQAAPGLHAQIVGRGESMSVLNRLGTIDEIANLAVFLASDDSSFITGQAICADGGYTTK
jgi:NAD(P)-dependent dehydrogenase (short-subunit alcohol dehydrogenase family)